ncbi:MFS multidrug transporter-like protein [Hyaloscypha bicolor E]|uniref:MFS multidrug transporter-like protein n=1 Tax=Hyaloscypha bicolor E TaxID=1095630 RepID=A0A2J6TN83_9HELO|nr:MFS multidrug transporter-like protein [Hyaloscypha bicolor E]PMD64418.1 MFS multidrug transporter-like protein [Hyaloscypha bicolor E]
MEANVELPRVSHHVETPVLPTSRLICLCISVSFGLFLSLMDTTIVATALYTIGADLKSLGSINWVALAYTLSYLGCAVIFVRIADIYGRRNAYIAAFLIFFAFSFGCGFSTSLTQLIACRTLQGVGGSGLYSLTFVILPEISPPGMMQAIGAIAGAVVAMAGVLGPVLGGVITHHTSWKWIFWINAPIGIGPLILFIIAWPKPNQLCPARRRPLKELDTIGAILIIAASVLIVFSFQEAGLKTNAWKQAIFIVPLAIGCLCAAALVGWEYFVAHSWEGKLATMFPLRLMESRVYMGCVATALLGGFPYFVVIYALPLRLQVVNEKSALLAGVSLLPMLGSVAIASALGGGIHRKRERIFGTLLAGSLFMVIGSACLSTLKNTVAVPAKMYGFEVFIGLGFGLMVSTVSLGAMIEADTLDRTVAQGVIAQARVFGGSIGIAASTAILGTVQRSQLFGIVTPEPLSALQTSAGTMTPAQLHAVRQVYSDSFSEGMQVCAAVSAACVIACVLAYRRHGVDLEARREESIREEDEMIWAAIIVQESS